MVLPEFAERSSVVALEAQTLARLAIVALGFLDIAVAYFLMRHLEILRKYWSVRIFGIMTVSTNLAAIFAQMHVDRHITEEIGRLNDPVLPIVVVIEGLSVFGILFYFLIRWQNRTKG